MKLSTSTTLGLLCGPGMTSVVTKADKQQMTLEAGVQTFKVSHFDDGRDLPYRIFFRDDVVASSSYRFDRAGDLAYIKAGWREYYRAGFDGSKGGKEDRHPDEFDCESCATLLCDVCGESRKQLGGLPDFCERGLSDLTKHGRTSAETLCDSAPALCEGIAEACDSLCDSADKGHKGCKGGDPVEASTRTAVDISASAYDTRHGEYDVGCGEDGCLPALAYDGETFDESRWSCAEEIAHGDQCEIEFKFETPQDLVGIYVDFWKGDERRRTLKVTIDGHKIGEYESKEGAVTTYFPIERDDVHKITLESLGLDHDEWISLLEVRFMVEPDCGKPKTDTLKTDKPESRHKGGKGNKDDNDGDPVEASTRTAVDISASAYDTRHGEYDVGCGEDGCLPALAYDGETFDESRWSCAEEIAHGDQCEIEFKFETPQDLVGIYVDFWKGDERRRTLKVTIDGHKIGEYESKEGAVTTYFPIERDDVHKITLESLGLDHDEWISLLEVRFMVKPQSGMPKGGGK